MLLSFSVFAQTTDADAIVSAYEKKAAAIREKAEQELQPHKDKAVAALQALQDTLCQQKKLDEALAVRERIRALRGVKPNPGALHLEAADIGKTLLFDVTGSTEGAVWGTEVFTSDTHLAAAAVHLGLLKPKESAVLRVRVIAGQSAYVGSAQHGVTSQPYGPWPVSFTLERLPN